MDDLRTMSLDQLFDVWLVVCSGGSDIDRSAILAELRRRDELFAEVVAKLRSLEWSSFDCENGNSCPCCYSEAALGEHDADCGLAILLAKVTPRPATYEGRQSA